MRCLKEETCSSFGGEIYALSSSRNEGWLVFVEFLKLAKFSKKKKTLNKNNLQMGILIMVVN